MKKPFGPPEKTTIEPRMPTVACGSRIRTDSCSWRAMRPEMSRSVPRVTDAVIFPVPVAGL